MVTQKMLRAHEKKKYFPGRNFVTSRDLMKCLKQIKEQRLLRMCAPISELPSNYHAYFIPLQKLRLIWARVSQSTNKKI